MWSEMLAYAATWGQLPSLLAPAPPRTVDDLAELMVRRLIALVTAEELGLTSQDENAVQQQLDRVTQGRGPDFLEAVERRTSVSRSELRALAREEASIGRILAQRFRYLTQVAGQDASAAAESSGDGTQKELREALDKAIDEWLTVERQHAIVRIELPAGVQGSTPLSALME